MASLRKAILVMIAILLFLGCAANDKLYVKNYHEDGIIFLEKDEPGIDKTKKSQKSLEKEKKNERETPVRIEQSVNSINPAGIIFLNYEDQVNEMSGRPLQLASYTQRGKASYYADKFQGRKTASGEIYDKNKLTAAHRSLKFGTLVRVTNLFNDKSVIVRINDRGPFVESRIIDLSYAAAKKIDMIDQGVAEVLIEAIEP